MTAFKLSKQELEQREKLIDELTDKAEALGDAVTAYNEVATAARAAVEAALAAYNESLEAARTFAHETANQADSDIGDRSEKWLESERGQAAVAWRDEWQAVDLAELEVDWPDDLDVSANHAGELEAIPPEVEP